MKLYDLSQPWSVNTPPWPTYPMPKVYFCKRIGEHKVNGQVIETSNHCGTHLDGPMHFVSHGGDIASIPLETLYGPGVIVDLSHLGDYDIIKPKDIEDRVEVREGDILVWNTGYHRYAWTMPEADEVRYFYKHPGPDNDFVEWALSKKLRWIGVDCGSADHPMNTILAKVRPDLAKECEEKHGKPIEEIFGKDGYQLMHIKLFPHNLIHAENLGGDIDKLLNRRITIGCFPWKFVGGESCICRIVAFDENA